MSSCSEVTLTPNRSLAILWSSDSLSAVVALVGHKNADLYQLFCESYLALLLDSPVDRNKPVSVLRKFLKKLTTEQPKALILSYSTLADVITQSMAITSDYTITGEFLDEMLHTPIAREYIHFYKTGDPLCLKYILSFLNFGKKMEYLDSDLEQNAFRDWLKIEEDMADLSIPMELIDHLRIIVNQFIPDIDDTIFLPHHGPGYTSEGFIDPNEKLDNLSLDLKSEFAFRSTSFGRCMIDRNSISQFLGNKRKEQVAKLRFVPKNVKTMRSICMETISRMFLQQEVSRWLINSMEQSPLRYLVNLHDQTPNQQYALGGSACYSCDTIDLSAASDRVHIKLVKGIFKPKILFYLLGTRTSIVDTKNGRVKLNKFAPMGSALCFPVESIIFASISILGYLMHHYKCESLGSPSEDWYYLYHIDKFINMMSSSPEKMTSRLLRPRIYGDDIISDYRITDNILILLTQCGLQINFEKSYIGGSPFRESCGIYAYDGVDVSPLLFRIPTHRSKLDARSLSSLFDAANRAGDYHYNHLRSCFINYVKRKRVIGIHGDISSSIPFTSNRDDFGIFTTNLHEPGRIRVNKRFQRDERRVLVIKSSDYQRRLSRYSEQYFYDQWMRARIRGGSDEINFPSSRIRPRATKVRLGWTPV